MADVCTHPDTWFDRSLCPEPCGAMHDRCTTCGEVVGGCAWEFEVPARPVTDAEIEALPVLDLARFKEAP
jgi:hypothetical protein